MRNKLQKFKCEGCAFIFKESEGHFVMVGVRKIFWCGKDECSNAILKKDKESKNKEYNICKEINNV